MNKLETKFEYFNLFEDELKKEIIKEIKNVLEFFKSDIVYLMPQGEVDDEIFGDYLHLVWNSGVVPYILNGNCNIRTDLTPSYIKIEDKSTYLHCQGEGINKDKCKISISEPRYGMTVNSLYSLLELLRNDEIIELNRNNNPKTN